MFEPFQIVQGNVIGIKITSEITGDEHDQLDALICKALAKWGRLRVLVIVKHYPAFSSAEALYEDLRTVKQHAEHIERMAVVGDRLWKRTWVGLFGLFSGIETDYFEMDRIQDARQWITG